MRLTPNAVNRLNMAIGTLTRTFLEEPGDGSRQRPPHHMSQPSSRFDDSSLFEDRLMSELTSALADGGLAGAAHHCSRGAKTRGTHAVGDSRRQSVMRNARANQSLS
jgi:hypothetical protein